MSAPTTSPSAHPPKLTGPSAPKLRDSCHACSASKVKCSREKPSCARCAKRGLSCEYLATRRAGRKHDNRASRSDGNTARGVQVQCLSEARNNAPTSSSSSGTGNLTPTSTHIQPPCFSGQQSSGYQDILPDIFPSMDPTFNSDFNDFLESPMSFPGLETLDTEGPAQHYICSEETNHDWSDSNLAAAFLKPHDAFSIMEEVVSERPTLSRPNSPQPDQASTINASDVQMSHDIHSGSFANGCLVHALGLLKQLFPNASNGCARSKTPEVPANTAEQLPTIQSAVMENAQIIDAISTMLQCSCSQDDYLLMVMSLIVFKVLGWYAAAARGTSAASMDDTQSGHNTKPPHFEATKSSRHTEQVLQLPAIVGAYCIDGEDQGRMAGQLVLSELHRAQGLVNQLSERLKKRGVSNGASLSTQEDTLNSQESFSDEENPSPFSTTLLDQLENDVRKRLRSLSSEIVSMLRHG